MGNLARRWAKPKSFEDKVGQQVQEMYEAVLISAKIIYKLYNFYSLFEWAPACTQNKDQPETSKTELQP